MTRFRLSLVLALLFVSTAAFGQSVADLSVDKTGPAVVAPGGNIIYAIIVNNAGPSAAGSVTLSDAVPAGTTFVSFAAPAGWTSVTPPVGGTGTITATNPSVPVATPQAFTLTVAVPGGAATGTTIVNTATVSTTASADPTPGNNTDSATTTVQGAAIPTASTTALMLLGALLAMAGVFVMRR